MKLIYNKLNLSFIILIIISLIFFYLKYNIFIDLFPRTDQSFYIKWIIDLTNSITFFPSGKDEFYSKLLMDSNSLLHNYFRRIYNDVGVIYNLVPIFFNFLIGKFINYNNLVFNFFSIFVNCLIPFLISYYLVSSINGKKYLKIYLSLLFYVFISSYLSIFYLAPLGIHNYGLFFLVSSVLILESRIYKNNLLDLQTIFLGILIPCFSHKFNVPIILLSVFLIIFLRYLQNKKIKRDVFLFIFTSIIILLPLIFFSFFGTRNLELLKIFFSLNIDNSNGSSDINFIFQIINYLVTSLKDFLYYFKNNLGYLGAILFLISLLNLKNKTVKVYLFSTFLIFLVLPLNAYIDRLFNYFLILCIFLMCQNLIKLEYKNKIYIRIVNIIFILIIFSNISLNLPFKNKNNFEKDILNKYPNNKIWNEKLDKIINVVKKENIVFYQYLARDVFLSVYNQKEKYYKIYSTPSVYDLSKKYLKKDFNYINSIKFDKNKFKNTYILFFGTEEFSKNLPKNFCYLQTEFFGKCEKLVKINYDNIKEPIKYEGKTHNYVLKLYKTLD